MKKILALIILSLALSQSVLAIGQLSKPIVIQDVLRGQEFISVLYFFNSEDKENTYELAAQGDIKDWALFYAMDDIDLKNPIDKINIPAKSSISARVKFTIPQDTANGTYSGQVLLVLRPENNSASQTASVFQKVGREVLITVTDKEVILLDSSIIPLEYDMKKGEPLKIKIIYENKGNVFLKPDVQLKIIRKDNTVFNAIFPYPEDEEPVRPYTRKVMPYIEWQTTGQETGNYRAEVNILYNGQVLGQDDFKFFVGFISTDFLAAIALIGGGNMVLGWFVMAAVLLALAIIFNIISKKPDFVKKLFKHD